MVVIRTPTYAKQSRLRKCPKNLPRQRLGHIFFQNSNDNVLPRRAVYRYQLDKLTMP